MEIKVYILYERFVDKINEGRIPGFYLTSVMPSGISIRHGEPHKEKPTGLIAKLMHERRLRKEKVICVANTTSGYLYAVNEDFQKRPGNTIRYMTLKFQ